MARLFQFGVTGRAPEYREFFEFPSMSLHEMREWMADSDPQTAIGLGAVVDEKSALAGEMVMLNGTAYMIGTDGIPTNIPENYRILFAQIGYMEPQKKYSFSASNMHELKTKLADFLREDASAQACMVRLTGSFPEITFRGCDAKGQKFSSLAETLNCPNATKHFNHTGKICSLVGFFSNLGAVDSDVTLEDTLHLHGIDAATQSGGHVMDFKGETKLEVEIMPITQWLTSTREAQERIEYANHTPRWTNRLMRCALENCTHAR